MTGKHSGDRAVGLGVIKIKKAIQFQPNEVGDVCRRLRVSPETSALIERELGRLLRGMEEFGWTHCFDVNIEPRRLHLAGYVRERSFSHFELTGSDVEALVL